MSTFYKDYKSKKSGSIVKFVCIDDYFGHHQYGYRPTTNKDDSVSGIEADLKSHMNTLTQEQLDKTWEAV